MNNKLKFLLSISAMSLVMVGCGGSGGDSTTPPPLSNSQVSDGTYIEGYYYGEDVLFGDSKIVGRWKHYSGVNPEEGTVIDYEANGLYLIIGYGYVIEDRYGVSDDGQKLTTPNVHLVSKDTDGCYTVSYPMNPTGANGRFCKVF